MITVITVITVISMIRVITVITVITVIKIITKITVITMITVLVTRIMGFFTLEKYYDSDDIFSYSPVAYGTTQAQSEKQEISQPLFKRGAG